MIDPIAQILERPTWRKEGGRERRSERLLSYTAAVESNEWPRAQHGDISHTSSTRCLLFEFPEVRRAIWYRGENHAAKALTSLEMHCVALRLNWREKTENRTRKSHCVDNTRGMSHLSPFAMHALSRHHDNNQSCRDVRMAERRDVQGYGRKVHTTDWVDEIG